MKGVKYKISAIIAMIISLFSFGFLAASFVLGLIGGRYGWDGFSCWIISVLIAGLSLFFYIVDAFLSSINISMKIHPIFNSVLVLMLVGTIPMFLYVGCRPGVNIYIWNAYYLAVFIMEVASVLKNIEPKPEDNNSVETDV